MGNDWNLLRLWEWIAIVPAECQKCDTYSQCADEQSSIDEAEAFFGILAIKQCIFNSIVECMLHRWTVPFVYFHNLLGIENNFFHYSYTMPMNIRCDVSQARSEVTHTTRNSCINLPQLLLPIYLLSSLSVLTSLIIAENSLTRGRDERDEIWMDFSLKSDYLLPKERLNIVCVDNRTDSIEWYTNSAQAHRYT